MSEGRKVTITNSTAVSETIVWVTCRIEDDASGDIMKAVWDILGVFSDEAKAVAACSKVVDFVGPVKLDSLELAGDERIEWPGGYYPLAETVEGQSNAQN